MSSKTSPFAPERLEQARVGRGLTMTALEEASGVSRQSISAYENGRAIPTEATLNVLAQALRLPVSFFTIMPQAHFKGKKPLFRALRSVGARDRDRVQVIHDWLAEVSDYALGYVNFPELQVPDAILQYGPANPKHITFEFVSSAAREVRAAWGLGQAPIPNLTRLLESHGIVVAVVDLELPGVDGLSMWSEAHARPYILLNRDDKSAARLRLTLAHELGHIVLHRNVMKASDGQDYSKLLDEQAYRFGREFLMPEEGLLPDVYSTTLESLRRVKSKWRISIAAIAYALRELSVISDSEHTNIMVSLGRRGWRRSEPYDDEWAHEQPVLLRQAFQLIAERGGLDATRILHETRMDASTLSRLTGLPQDYFQPNQPENLIVFRPSRQPEQP